MCAATQPHACLQAVRIHKQAVHTFACRLQGFGALLVHLQKPAIAAEEPPASITIAIDAVRCAADTLQVCPFPHRLLG